MRIAFAMTPEWGGYIPAFPLARKLQSRGHDIFFFGLHPSESHGLSRLATYVEHSGFKFVPLPKFPSPPRNVFARLRSADAMVRMVVDRAEESLRRHRIDVALVDPIISVVALAGARCGVRVLELKTNLASPMDPAVPPVTSDYVPRGDAFDRPVHTAYWIARWLKLNVADVHRAFLLNTHRWTRQEARHHGLHCRFTEYGRVIQPRVKLCLAPKEFDFHPRPGYHYLGGHIERHRPEQSMHWPAGFLRRPVVYCSLGSNTEDYGGVPRMFFRRVVRAFMHDRRHSLVLHVGHTPEEDICPEGVPSHMLVRSWVPQLDVLEHSSAMITHGGLGAIKECIVHKVPMAVFPITYDQPGNAARVVFHGLGVKGDIRSGSSGHISKLVRQIIENREDYLRRLDRIRHHALDPEPMEEGVRMIEECVQAHTQAVSV